MKYSAPDYEKVALCATDIFAAYTGCPEDEFLIWNYTVPCEGNSDYRQEASTFTGIGWGTGCYSTQNP